MRGIPLWIKFPGLNVGYWSAESLSKLASFVGKPLFTDKFTAQQEKISFPRLLVDVDISCSLPGSVEFETPVGTLMIGGQNSAHSVLILAMILKDVGIRIHSRKKMIMRQGRKLGEEEGRRPLLIGNLWKPDLKQGSLVAEMMMVRPLRNLCNLPTLFIQSSLNSLSNLLPLMPLFMK